MSELFRKVASASSYLLGSPWIFILNLALILLWLAVGPLFNFSDTWQLWVNTATTVITYLAVFLIQNTQNRSDAATHAKLDELIRAIKGANNKLIALDNQPDKVVAEVRNEIEKNRE